MNSEFYNEQIKPLEEAQDVVERQRKMRILSEEKKIIDDGQEAESFKAHRFWKQFETDLKIIRESLVNSLVQCKGTKQEIQEIQIKIKLIDLFIATPEKYIQRMKNTLESKRRRKE